MQKFLKRILTNAVSRSNGGFTMIELLIVITILGILATAVLSAINPVEQINRGRDTGTRSDAEQLLSSIERYNAFQGFYPWVNDPADATTLAFTTVDVDDWYDIDGSTGKCEVLEKLSDGDDTATSECTGTEELKASFLQRVSNTGYNKLYIYNSGETGASTYVCFQPQSGAFKREAEGRCTAGMPSDIASATAKGFCGDKSLKNADAVQIDKAMICLP